MENNDFEPNKPYGWDENASPEPSSKKKDKGKRTVLALIGAGLILFGLSQLIGVVAIDRMGIGEASAIFENTAEVVEESINATIAAVDEGVTVPATQTVTQTVTETVTVSESGSSHSQVDMTDVNEIVINAAAAELTVVGYDADMLDIAIDTYHNVVYEVQADGGTVTIDSSRNYGVTAGGKTDRIVVKVPRGYTGDLSLTFAAGKTKLSDIGGSVLHIEAAAGEFTFENIAYDEIDMDISAGAATGYGITARSLDVQMGQGQLDLAGDLGETHCESVAAAVTLRYDVMPESISLEGSLGTIDLYLPGDSAFQMQDSAMMGRVNSEIAPTADAESEISVDMAMGTVNIHKK